MIFISSCFSFPFTAHSFCFTFPGTAHGLSSEAALGVGSGADGGFGPFPTGWQGPDCCECPLSWVGGTFVPAPLGGHRRLLTLVPSVRHYPKSFRSFLQVKQETQGLPAAGGSKGGGAYPLGRAGPKAWQGPDCCPCNVHAKSGDPMNINPYYEGPFGVGRQGF